MAEGGREVKCTRMQNLDRTRRVLARAFHVVPSPGEPLARDSAGGCAGLADYFPKKIGMIKIATMFTTLIIGLIAGPLVSL